MKYNLIRLARYPAPIRLAVFVLVLLLIWLPVAAPIYSLVSDRNLVSIITMVLLYGEFIFLLRLWGQKVYQQPQLLKNYGLQGVRQNARELLWGLSLGLIVTLSLFSMEGLLGWLRWQLPPDVMLPKVILEGSLTALGAGFAEELLFRGWLLDELQRDYRLSVALWVDASLFALLHFIKPLAEVSRTFVQFPALLLLGLTLVWAKRSCKDRLGISIGLHAGLIWGYYIINVGQLVQYSGKAPEWITGIDKNPLSGVMGLLFLGVLAFWMQKRSLIEKRTRGGRSNHVSRL